MPPSVLPIHVQDAPEKSPAPVTPFSARSAQTTRSVVNNLDAVLEEIRQVNHDVTHLYGDDDEDTDDDAPVGSDFKSKVCSLLLA
jgi:hypothetical protein